MKKMLKKATIIMLITCALLLNSVSGTVLAGPAAGQEYDLTGLDLSKATVKPTLTVSTHRNVEKGNSVTVTITVGNADGKYATTGIWLNYDDRGLNILPNENGELVTKGPAGEHLTGEVHRIYESNEIYLATDASGNYGKDGVLWSIDFECKDDYIPNGSRLPVEISYKHHYYAPDADDENTVYYSRFINIEQDEEGRLMDAYVFTEGIEHGYITFVTGHISATATGYKGGYDGQPHGINVQVTTPASGATVKYKNSEGEYVLTECPTITDVKDSPMTVEYQITADGYYTETGSATVELAAIDPTAPQGLTAVYGQTLSDVNLPDGWSWVDDSLSVVKLGENTFKANYTPTSSNYNPVNDVDVSVSVKKAPSELTETPSANSLTYNEQDQQLITEGVAKGGKVFYALGNEKEATEAYSEDIPSGKDADTYTVWYYVQGDSNHNSTDKKSVKATISKADISPSVSMTGWTIGDNPNSPSVSGNPGNGTVKYQYKAQGADDSSYSDAIPTEAGAYTVRASIEETQNYNAGTATADFTIKPICTVIWLDGDESELDKKTYPEGDAEPTTDKIPAKANEDSSYFEFDRWDSGTINGATKTYTPSFTKKPLYSVEIETLEHTMGDTNEKSVKIIGNQNNTGLVDRVKSIGVAGKNVEFGKDVKLADGSLIITFAPAYLDSLGVGEHVMNVVFEDGETTFLIHILEKAATSSESPATGDGFSMILLIVMMFISLTGAAAMVRLRRKNV